MFPFSAPEAPLGLAMKVCGCRQPLIHIHGPQYSHALGRVQTANQAGLKKPVWGWGAIAGVGKMTSDAI
jgi:hypothetical protein